MQRDELLQILRAYKRERGEEYGILEIGVFGSSARETAGNGSDVDICVKTRTPDPYALVHIKEELEQRLGARVDIVRVRDRMNTFLKARIEAEGVYA